MADSERYAKWIIDNASKKGTPEFDIVAKAYKESIAKGNGQVSNGLQNATASQSPDNSDNSAQYMGRKISDMSAPSKFLIGTGNEAQNLYRGFKQAYNIGDQKELSKDIASGRKLGRELEKYDSGYVGNLFGSIAPVIMTGGASLPGAIASGVAYGALQPTLNDESRGENMAIGGALGTVGPAVGTVLGGLGSRGIMKASPQAKRLMEQGIQPTIGQGINQNILGRAIRSIEEGSKSIPWVGSVVKDSRDRAVKEARQSFFNDIAKTAGIPQANKANEEGLSQLYTGFNGAYKSALRGHELPITTNLVSRVSDIIDDPNRFMNDDTRKFLTNYVQSNFNALNKSSGKLKADELHEMTSNLKAKARELKGSQDAMRGEAGRSLDDIAESLSEYRNDYIPEDLKKAIKSLDTGYAKYKIAERASSSVGAKEGEFSPAQLYNAVRALDKSKDKGAFARGTALGQRFASDANVLSDTMGDSGTAPRMLNSNLMAQILGVAGIAPAKALSSRGFSKYVLGGYRGQRAAENTLRNILTPLSIRSVSDINDQN